MSNAGGVLNYKDDYIHLLDAPGIEETLRDKYFVAKEGESIVVVVEEEPIVQEEKDGGFEFFRKFLEIFK
mgnify:CR=1 FL=1